jgi:hypothetical protein
VKVIYFLLVIVFLVVVVIGLLNLVSMFDEGSCVCLDEANQCELYSEIRNPKPVRKYQRKCGEGTCKYFFGRCYKLHRFLDITYVIRGK